MPFSVGLSARKYDFATVGGLFSGLVVTECNGIGSAARDEKDGLEYDARTHFHAEPIINMAKARK